MKRMLSFLERNALALAMVVGAVGQSIFRHLNFLLPPLIFFMLFFTFCKINPLDLRLRRWHWIVLGVQLALVVGVMAMGYGILAIGDGQCTWGWLLVVDFCGATTGFSSI